MYDRNSTGSKILSICQWISMWLKNPALLNNMQLAFDTPCGRNGPQKKVHKIRRESCLYTYQRPFYQEIIWQFQYECLENMFYKFSYNFYSLQMLHNDSQGNGACPVLIDPRTLDSSDHLSSIKLVSANKCIHIKACPWILCIAGVGIKYLKYLALKIFCYSIKKCFNRKSVRYRFWFGC